MDVVYSPYNTGSNAYVYMVTDGLRRSGCNVVGISDFFNRGEKDPVPVILNWEDEIRGSDLPRTIWHYLKKKMFIHQVLSRGGRIIYVVHNRVPHDVDDGLALMLSGKIRRFLATCSSSIVVLCDETRCDLKRQLGVVTYAEIEDKILKIPIPSYTGYYPKSDKDWRAEYGVSADKFLFVFTGLIRPYKGVELIFDVAEYFMSHGYDAEFLIAGRCSDSDYERALFESCPAGGNIHLSFGFVKDNELGELVEASNALLLPMDIRSSLNSSSCYLAFSYGRTVVCPLIGTLREFDEELFYSYEYENPSEHREKIIAAAEQAYFDWKENPDAYSRKGKRLKFAVDSSCSVDKVGESFKRVVEISLLP